MNPQQNQQPSQISGGSLNPTAQILTNAILKEETGGDYKAVGDNGASHGGYQWNPGTWATEASKVGIDVPVNEATPAQQNQVAYSTINSWLQSGKNPAQVASMWNAGEGEPDAYTGNFSNGAPSVVEGKYDVPGYVKNVLSTASNLWKSKNPGALQSTASAVGQAAGSAYNAVGGAKGLAIGGGLLAGAAALAPEALAGAAALGGEALGGLGDFGDMAGNAVKGFIGDVAGGAIGNAIQGNQTSQSQDSNSGDTGQLLSSVLSEMNAPSKQSSEASQSPLYQTLTSMANSMVGGKQALQEAESRGVDPVASMIATGAIPQPDENGNLDKESALGVLDPLISQDNQQLQQAASQEKSMNDLDAMEVEAINEARTKKKGIGKDLLDTLKQIHSDFEGYRLTHPDVASGLAKPNESGEYRGLGVSSGDLLHMKQRMGIKQGDWRLGDSERTGAQHVYETFKKTLERNMEKSGIKGWKETNKRMEARLLAKKLIQKMPKKAQRAHGKELARDIASSLAGGAVAKLLGQNTFAGNVAGYLIDHRLGGKQYKKIGSRSERKEIEKRRQIPQKGLISAGK